MEGWIERKAIKDFSVQCAQLVCI